MLEYATRQTALLLDYELVHGRDPVHPFLNELYSFGSWAEPKVQQLRQFMRRLFQNPPKVGKLEVGPQRRSIQNGRGIMLSARPRKPSERLA
jgi:hypothetical protein